MGLPVRPWQRTHPTGTLTARYRNRRIGEFLKELVLAEGRFTGIPKMREAMRRNGSPPPTFATDADRTFFGVELRIHPTFVKARQEAEVEAEVELNETERQVLRSLGKGPLSVQAIAHALGHKQPSGNLWKALDRLDRLGLIGLTIPDKPKSSKQKRQLTAKGRRTVQRLDNGE